MSYVKTTDFASKDALLSGNPAKLVKGVEIDDEFNAIQVADADNVKGPGSATNNAVALYDGTTGKLIKDSAKTLPSGTIVGHTDTQTLTNKTITFADNTLTGVASTSTTQTLTNKTVDLTSNTLTGTKAQFDTACTDDNFAYQSDIGVSIQGYDVDTAKLDVDQSWTGSQRGAITTDNDLSFDMNASNNFTCTPTAGGALTFTNITAGQSGYVLLVNGSNYAITAAATTKISTADLTKISATGTYLVSYYSNGTNVYVSASGNLA